MLDYFRIRQANAADHQRMGFTLMEGDDVVGGFPVFTDYPRPNDPKILFRLQIKD